MYRMGALLIGVFALAVANGVSAQTIRGRMIEENSRRPVPCPGIVLLSSPSDTIVETDASEDGFFSLRVPHAGTYQIAFACEGFAAGSVDVSVDSADVVLPAYLLQEVAIPIDPIDVEVEASGSMPSAFSSSSHVVSGARMAALEKVGAPLMSAIRDLPTIRTKHLRQYTLKDGRRVTEYLCIESTRRMMTMRYPPPACEPVLLAVDGIVVNDVYDVLRGLNLQELESIEFLPPLEAGTRYGSDAGTYGALEVWTRGRGPHASDSRNGGG